MYTHVFYIHPYAGILDRPLEERNTIEMQAITALAHLQCCILYFLDISEQCGFSLDQQLHLFESIRPLFANKQVILVANKIDVLPYESLPAHHRKSIEDAARNANAELIPMSNISEENISKLKITACDKLLEARVDSKLAGGRVKVCLLYILCVFIHIRYMCIRVVYVFIYLYITIYTPYSSLPTLSHVSHIIP